MSQYFKNKYLLLSFLGISLFSCSKIKPEGEIAINEISVDGFSQIETKGKFRVFFIHSDKNKIEAETYPNVFKNLDVQVENSKLVIGENRETKGVDFYNITIYSTQNPQKISLSDSIDFNISGELKTQNLQLNLKNNAKFIGAIRTDKTEINMQDTSLANIKGFTKNAMLKLKDTAGIIAPYWQVNQLDIQAKNHTYAEVNANELLSGNLSDTSKMLFYNQPVQKFKHSPKTSIQNKTLD